MNNRGNEHCGSGENEIDVMVVIWESVTVCVCVEGATRMDLKNG